MNKEIKPIPKFKNEDEEHAFWAEHDSADYIDWSKAVWVNPKEQKLPEQKPRSWKPKISSYWRYSALRDSDD